MSDSSNELVGRLVAVPESRQLDLFADMLERRGAAVLRCPLVSIHDTPDQAAVFAWIEHCVTQGLDHLVLLTGEGLRRLVGVAERHQQRDDFIAALQKMTITTRGPKPERALRDIGLRGDLKAAAPTTAGVIETLGSEELGGLHVGVQLYGEPNPTLVSFLEDRGAHVHCVAPYIYADESETTAVDNLIRKILAAEIDALAFTSSPQVRRLFSVAQSSECESELIQAMNGLCIAAVGPIVAEALSKRGITAIVQPESSFFMKPLVTQMCRKLGPA